MNEGIHVDQLDPQPEPQPARATELDSTTQRPKRSGDEPELTHPPTVEGAGSPLAGGLSFGQPSAAQTPQLNQQTHQGPQLGEPAKPAPTFHIDADRIAPPFYKAPGVERAPRWPRQQEKPHHRLIAILSAEGRSAQEIADTLDLCIQTVRDVKKEPFCQKLIAELQAQAGINIVRKKLELATPQAAQTLVDIMSGAIDSSPGVRKQAAESILDRVFGPTPQTINHITKDASELTSEELKQFIVN